MPNALANESSPYLRQHADNPVNWLPWGDEAFARARRDDRPILLSIGYAACHWCHVMAHESFEDPVTAELMNRLFVNVKVDREERPDVDGIYMQAVQALTGQGGWPMTMFLTPDGRPFYGGTYYPPEDRHGMPSFRRVLARVDEAWRTQRESVERGAAGLMRVFERSMQSDGVLTPQTLVAAAATARSRVDPVHGGFGGAPKFPPTMLLEFLLTRWARTGDAALLAIVQDAWRHMAGGGLHDQIGGGFHRYTVDAAWLVPHFEKMLYDNALLIRLGTRLWQATGDASVRTVVERATEWLAREMTAEDGTWYASLDADSEGHEGKFYTWSHDEMREVLGADDELLLAWWDASPSGNFEGVNIPWTPHASDAFVTARGITSAMLDEAVTRGRAALHARRATRIRPARDEKVIAAWNGLMLRGIAEAARCFDDAGLRAMAVHAGEGLLARLVRDGRAARTAEPSGRRVAGVLEDQAALALGFLALHELSGEARWISAATQLSATAVAQYWDEAEGTWYDTAADGEALVTRPHDPFDNAHPAGASLAVELDLRLHALDGDAARLRRAATVLDGFASGMGSHPQAFGHLLGAADLAIHGIATLVLTRGEGRAALETAARGLFVPGLQLVDADSGVPVSEGRTPLDGLARAYLCRGFTCELPVTQAPELARQLAAVTRRSAE